MALKTRRILSFVVSLLVLASVFAACQPAAPAPAPAPAPATNDPAAPAAPQTEAPAEPAPTVDFPTKPIRVIIPVSAGGFSDLNARLLTDVITEEKLFSQPMIVVNITGANGAEGIKAAMDSDADGYTLMFWQTLSYQSQYLMGGIPYSAFDLEPLAQVIEVPNLLVALADAPYNTVEEMLAYAEANPGEVRFCHSGVGNSTHLAQEMFFKITGCGEYFKVVGVAGGAESLTAHLGKQVDVRFSTALDSIRYVESGDFKLLATTGTESPEGYPDVPTMIDLGYDVVFTNKQGYWVPKGTPEEVKKILADAIEKATQTARYAEYCDASFADPVFTGLSDFEGLLRKDDEMISEIVDQIKSKG